MECRTGLVLALSLTWCAAGCITQTETRVGNEVKLSPPKFTIPGLTKDDKKRIAKPATIIALAKYQEEVARDNPELTQLQREDCLQLARKAYLGALAQEPDNVEAVLGLSRVYHHLNDYEQAQDILEKHLKKQPRSAALWFGLGTLHCRRKTFDKGIECYRKALDLEPENRDCASALGYTLVLNDRIAEGVQVFKKLYGEEAKAHYRVALMMTWLHRWDKARQHAELALRSDPTYINAREMLAQLDQPPPADGPVASVSFHTDAAQAPPGR